MILQVISSIVLFPSPKDFIKGCFLYQTIFFYMGEAC